MRNYENTDKMAVSFRLLFPDLFINEKEPFIDGFF
jgi:hypothetical protein